MKQHKHTVAFQDHHFTTNNERFVDTRGASLITGIPIATLVTYRSRGGGPRYFRLKNGRIRYAVSDLANYVRADGPKRSTAEYQVIPKESEESINCNDPQGSDEEDSDDPH